MKNKQTLPIPVQSEPAEDPQEFDASEEAAFLEKIFILLRTQTGNDFSLYKRTTIYRRVEWRMGLHQIDKIANTLRFLQEYPQEIELIF